MRKERAQRSMRKAATHAIHARVIHVSLNSVPFRTGHLLDPACPLAMVDGHRDRPVLAGGRSPFAVPVFLRSARSPYHSGMGTNYRVQFWHTMAEQA